MKRFSARPVVAALAVASLAFAGSALAQTADQYYGQDDYGQQDSYRDYEAGSGYDTNQNPDATYDYARVLRVDPVIGQGYDDPVGRTAPRCNYRQADDVYASNGYSYDRNGGGDVYSDKGYGSSRVYRSADANRTVATVIGGIAGAVLGNQIGHGSGRFVGTAVGTMVGSAAGRSIYDSSQQGRQYERRGTVRVCEPLQVTRQSNRYLEDETLQGYDVTYEYANRTYHTRTSYHPGDRIRVRVDVQAD